MPILAQGGAMNIVAHIDDDLLFMNPDIAEGIANGSPSTTIYVTAGDAGGDEAYWQGREDGAKAAYAQMAGHDDWVDELVTVTHDGQEFTYTSSYLESAPDVRLYFMRLPDGAGAIEDPEDYQALARLEDGTRSEVSSLDGANTFSRDGLVDALTAVIDAHAPEDLRLQVADGPYADGEHTDHIHTTEFALEALGQVDIGDPQITHYVNYQSDDLVPNLSEEDAALSLDIMNTYAAYDSGVTDEFGSLLPVYVEWTGRQYVADSYLLSDLPSPDVDDPIVDGPGVIDEDPEVSTTHTFSLLDQPDGFLFLINEQTGEITPKDWFFPSLDDAWDQDEDFVYNVVVTLTPLDGSASTTQTIQFETIGEGELEQQNALDTGGGPTEPSDPVDPPPEPDDPPIEPDDPPADPPPPDPDPDEPADDPDPVTDPPPDDPIVFPIDLPTSDEIAQYRLSGEDEFLFVIDAETGAISPKDWFIPTRDDAWDQDENHLYELILTGVDVDGGEISRQFLTYEVTLQNELVLVSAEEDILLELALPEEQIETTDLPELAELEDPEVVAG